jgi:hypothetical protein
MMKILDNKLFYIVSIYGLPNGSYQMVIANLVKKERV